MRINILHIINGYWGRDLYAFLVSKLAEKNTQQTVFVPLRNPADKDKYKINKENVTFLYPFIIKSIIYRLLFCLKIKKIIKYIEANSDVKNYNLSYSHTLFSDGAVSYYLYKKYGIKYITTVRNTDMNIFFKYLIHLSHKGKRVLYNSEKIIFLSEAYKQRLIRKYVPKKKQSEIEKKSVILPNGINNFWFENLNKQIKYKTLNGLFTIVFAGEYSKNKNIHSIILSVLKLIDKGYEIKLKLIGLGYKDNKKYLKYLKKLRNDNDNIEFIKFQEKEELIKSYRNADIFMMPSFNETFGLVYAEALTQGLPLIYTKNEGFDKNFDEGFVGYSVNPNSVNNIVSKLESLILNYNKIQGNCANASLNFKWENISEKLWNLIKEIN